MKLIKALSLILALLLSATLVFAGCTVPAENGENSGLDSSLSSDLENSSQTEQNGSNNTSGSQNNTIPAFSGDPFVIVNNNLPTFSKSEIVSVSFENYSNLDSLGRCGVATACVGKDIMPTEPRGEIGQVKPTGWHTVKYDIVDGKYLYNRCHLIGFQLTGENANKQNLITGTRYFNVDGMLPFENMVADYVKETNNHVMYRVTPVYEGDNLVANGVYMEAYSVEDSGEGVCFNVFVYNCQPGIIIDYATGESWLTGENSNHSSSQTSSTTQTYNFVLNTNTKKFHFESCVSAKKISAANRKDYEGSRQALIDQGYTPCGNCKP